MATYAEYPANVMAANDFTLYPYQEVWDQEPQPYMPPSTYAEQSYLSAFDSFQAPQGYALPDQYHMNPQPADASVKNPHYSPAISASHSLDLHHPPVLSSTSDSGASALSSAIGSPSTHPQVGEWMQQPKMQMMPTIVSQADGIFATSSYDFETNNQLTGKDCVDPALIQPYSPRQFSEHQILAQSPPPMQYPHAPSPVPSNQSRSPRTVSGKIPSSASPYMRSSLWQPYPQNSGSRRQSVSSAHSGGSQQSGSSDDSNKGLCPIATCGRHVKDLKAHMLTHQNERPEKCPIPTCEYHMKGFARKYDKNRHTLTHYKGTMVCGFCPGSGSAVEKSFNRADVFKRHLTSVHGVEQNPPNARRKSPTGSKRAFGDASGMCSTCNNTFASAQDFYEHLDDCVLRVVQQAEPSEAINAKLLGSVAEDKQVQETMEKHMLPTTVDFNAPTSFDEEEIDEEEEGDDEDSNDVTYCSRVGKSTKGAIKSRKAAGNSSWQSTPGNSHVSSSGAVGKPINARKGLTLSKNGVPLAGGMSGKGSKRKKNYPLSWGAAPEKMTMKKRVLCVYDGQRRLWKDDMMLDASHEVRIPIGDGRSWVTDLDVQTLRRAEGLHNATDEEKGPWVQDEGELERLMQ